MVLFYQRQQLFKRSIDSEGLPLGFYKSNGLGRKALGKPFTMVNSGLFKRKLFYKNGVISSHVPYLRSMKRNPAYLSNRFFGLTESSYERFNKYRLKPFINSWMQRILEEG